MKKFILLTFVVLTLTGCQSMGERQTVGALLGAAGGGLLGSQFGGGSGQLAMTALGAVGGLMLGSEMGRSMDDVDRLKQQRAASTAFERLPSGQSSSWSNPDSGYSGDVTPVRTYREDDGRYCREFTHTVRVGGKQENAYGTACRRPDGTWEII